MLRLCYLFCFELFSHIYALIIISSIDTMCICDVKHILLTIRCFLCSVRVASGSMQKTVSVQSGVSLFRSGSEWSWTCQYCQAKGAGRAVNRHIDTAIHQSRLRLMEQQAIDRAEVEGPDFEEFDAAVQAELNANDGYDEVPTDLSCTVTARLCCMRISTR